MPVEEPLKSIAISPEDQTPDRPQSDANNAAAVATAERARGMAAFSQTTLVRLLLVSFIVDILTALMALYLVVRA